MPCLLCTSAHTPTDVHNATGKLRSLEVVKILWWSCVQCAQGKPMLHASCPMSMPFSAWLEKLLFLVVLGFLGV